MFDPDAPALEGTGVYGLTHTAERAGVILIPVPWEPTTSYGGGASRGPEAIRKASRQVDLHDVETGEPWQAGIHMLEEDGSIRTMNDDAKAAAEDIIATGGVIDEDDEDLQRQLALVNELGDFLNRWLRRETDRWLAQDKLVGVIGGDHSVPFGAIQAAALRHPGLGILHLDAHADLREAYEGFVWSHASIMRNVMTRIPEVAKLVQVGLRDVSGGEQAFAGAETARGRIASFLEPDLAAARFRGTSWQAQCEEIAAALPKKVWLSFDIDGLDPTLCPHTGTPVPGGLSFPMATHLLRVVVESGRRVVGLDLTEVAPGPDGDEWDGNVGARLLYKMIGWSLKSRSAA